MPTQLSATARVLFQGDSITAAGRDTDDPDDLGHGYVAMAADRLRPALPSLSVVNRGVSGHRVTDLRARWTADAVDLRPDLLSVMVGINDTWRRYDSGVTTSAGDFERDYRALLDRSRDGGARLLLIEPFLVPVRDEQWTWREDLDARIQVVRRLAAEYDAALLAADGLLNQAAREAGDPVKVTEDGIHPTAWGHALLAEAWTRLVALP
ncbi:SGNH/GDSL hydrolase family protein [Streptomyces sp. NPDC003247]|uniref:SGNH/GDSL hydrolase family protein n=1 Tax=Streptomyces sp. NPDC003247 TaxID=3364677 RepID=UPI0036A5A78C